MIPIMIHVMFNFITLGSKGGVVEAASTAPAEQVAIGILAVGTIAWAWGGFLLWNAGKKRFFASPSLNVSPI